MIDRWAPMRLLTDYTPANNDVMGWISWLKWLYANADWAYGAAHANGGLQLQSWAETQNTIEVWRGDVKFRSEHPTLVFSGRQFLNAGDGYTALEYYGADGAWHTIETDATRGSLRFFGGTTERTYNASGWALPSHGVLEVRWMIYGTSGGWAQMYRAYMTGWVGLTTWPTLPTFSNTVHPASDFNKLVTALEYLRECAKRPNLGSETFVGTHTQDGSYEPIGRWCWRQGGAKRLYVWLAVTDCQPGEHVYVFLEPDTYHPDTGPGRLNGGLPVVDISGDNPGQGFNIDLTSYGCTVGQRYAVEVGILKNIRLGGPVVTVGAVTLGDLGGVTRTYAPLAEYPYGSQPDAAAFNRLKNDIDQMYPAADRESPLWYEHPLASWRTPDTMGPLDRFHWRDKRYRIRHRGRFLEVRTRGGAKIVSADRTNETTIADSKGDPLTVDTESIPWLGSAFGQDYTVESYGTNEVLVAYEEYE